MERRPPLVQTRIRFVDLHFVASRLVRAKLTQAPLPELFDDQTIAMRRNQRGARRRSVAAPPGDALVLPGDRPGEKAQPRIVKSNARAGRRTGERATVQGRARLADGAVKPLHLTQAFIAGSFRPREGLTLALFTPPPLLEQRLQRKHEPCRHLLSMVPAASR